MLPVLSLYSLITGFIVVLPPVRSAWHHPPEWRGTSTIGCPFKVRAWVGVGEGVGMRPTLVPGALVNTCAVFHNIRRL